MRNIYGGFAFLLLALAAAIFAACSVSSGQVVFPGRRLRWHDATVILIAGQPVLFCFCIGFCVLFTCVAALFGRRLILGLD